MEKYGGNLPKARKVVRKRATTLADTTAKQDIARVKAQVKKARASTTTVKVDTRDVLKAVPASERKRITNVVVVKPKGAKHKVTVSTGDVLQGIEHVPAAKPKPAKRPSFGEALKQELEGKGSVAEALSRASGPVAKALIHEPEPLMYKGKPVKNADTSGIPGVHAKLGPFAQRFAKDLVNFPAQAVPSVYVPAAAAVEAVKGDKSRGRKLLHDLPHTDPVAALVTGHPKRALKIANEHPGFTALEAFGVKGAIGRGVGRVMRAAPKGTRVHQLASTTRADRTVPGTTLAQKQSYSPDVGRKAVQVANERRRAKRAAVIQAKGVERQDPELLANAQKLDPTRMSDQEIRKRVDERVAANETIRRHNRTVAVEEAHRAITNTRSPTGGPLRRAEIVATNRRTRVKPTAATTLRAQAITSATVKDLRAYRDELAAQHDALGPSQALANRTLRKQIDKAIASNPDPVALKQAAERYAQVVAPRQAALVAHGLLDTAQVEKAPLVPYAVRHMGAEPGEHGPVRGGAPVATAEIRAHMKRSGVEQPVYVTQAPGQRGAKNFFVSSGRPPQISTGTRTGAATVKGTLDAHPDVLLEGAAKMQGLIDAADGYTATVHEFAHKPTLGHLKTKKEADQAARDLNASTGSNWRAVRIHPFGADNAQLKALLDKASGEGDLGENVGAHQPVKDALDAAIKGHDGPGPWALMPEAAAARFAQHLHNLGVGPKAKALQVAGSGFRRTVLATSPTWMTGNVTEAALRSALGRAGPRSYVTGRRVVKRLEELDPNAAQQLTARATGGGHFSMADRQHIRRDSSQFAGSTTLEPLARGLGAFWRAPGPKLLAQAWHGWTDLVFRQLNGRLESQFQTAMLGKALRDSPLMSDHLRKLSEQAIDQAAHGLRDTNEQARFAREVERMYGKYSAFSPDTRWAIATYTPFIAWTLNAVKFVTTVLPMDHPAATALIASAELQTKEWRKDHGLDLFMKGALPGFLQGSIPLSGGRHQRAPFRYTPFGAFGDPLDTAAGAVLPQFTGVLAAFKGEDWKGAKLRKPDGSPADIGDKLMAAAGSFADATVPIVAQAKRIGDKGIGALNPVAPVAPRKPKARKASAGRSATSEQDIDALLGADHTQRDIDALLNNLP
jgi:hypothetical protein